MLAGVDLPYISTSYEALDSEHEQRTPSRCCCLMNCACFNNYLYFSNDTFQAVSERACLDRRRLTEAHLKYAILLMYQRYEGNFSRWFLSLTVKEMLEIVTPTFYKAFSAYYTCKLWLQNAYPSFHHAQSLASACLLLLIPHYSSCSFYYPETLIYFSSPLQLSWM